MATPRERRLPPPSFRMENPFSVKVLQVFTGFGVGCGVGIGVGRPIYLGMIPGLQQVMSATRGATDAFSGVTRHVNSAMRTAGLRNIEAGIGCGVGIGHGFGIGIALKPRVLHEIQSLFGEVMSKFTSRLKDTPGESSASNPTARSLSSNQQSHTGMPMDLDSNTAERSFNHTTSNEVSRGQPTHVLHGQHVAPPEALPGTRTEQVISNFLQSPLFQNDSKLDFSSKDASGNLHGMDNVLQLVIKHQRIIEELREENENLRQILVEELKVSPTKLQIDRKHGVNAFYPCSDCFECRRRSRKTTR
ncbi:hypothetical protein PR202_ga07860 [Eleusine coracana subsp. coracana]|uniref:Uncharacterized protein n=1 Tax=Eleusine coracana subsp. coracana TaxID=191504 RepID=A0AAV5BYM1_ELECO|nr:hypothetical protein PR202_ga07860 [Eleusine coracana subsp. coracana]